MTREEKLRVLADSAKYDASCASSGARRAAVPGGLGSSDGTGICHSYTPDGRCVSLLKILLTNFCVYDCVFCVNRVGNDIRRARFSVEEVVDLTLDFYRRNYIEGLFLSSGIIQSPDYTMEQLVAVARTLRETHRFGGYIHLKVIPGASDGADRRGRALGRSPERQHGACRRASPDSPRAGEAARDDRGGDDAHPRRRRSRHAAARRTRRRRRASRRPARARR